ncbi:membrane fusion protein of the MexEF-OprN multidrug efflux complex [compost metagenome]
MVNGLQRAMPGAPVEPQAVPMADDATLDQLARLRQSVEGRDAPRVAERNAKPSVGPRG